jgi:hypothetical protein
MGMKPIRKIAGICSPATAPTGPSAPDKEYAGATTEIPIIIDPKRETDPEESPFLLAALVSIAPWGCAGAAS